MTSSDSKPPTQPPLTFEWAREQGEFERLQSVMEKKVLKKRQRRSRLRRGLAGAALMVAVGLWLVPLVRQTDTITTAAQHRQSLTLVDGSSADLNAGTSLDTDFRYGRRTVRMERGEAYFSVAKDTTHPFLVETPAGTVRVTGTRFNVRVPRDGTAEITLLEGAVEIQPGPASAARFVIPMIPGQQFGAGRHELRTLDAGQLENVISWRTGYLALTGLTLEEAVARFAVYHGREIKLAPELASLRPGGSYALDDLPGFIEFLRQAFPVTVLAQPDGSFRIVEK